MGSLAIGGSFVTQPAGSAPPTVVLAANSAWNILNFRRALLEALRAAGWHVIALAPDDGNAGAIRALGAEFEPIRVDSSGTSPLRDARLFRDYLAVLRRLRPQAFLGFTVKPNVYGSLAARLLGIRTINNISGLGTAFMGRGPLNRLVIGLYRLALRQSHRVFFQNPNDLSLFIGQGLVRAGQASLVPGSGIDLERFRPSLRPSAPGRPFRFLFVGRLLRDKGLVEYAQAARLLRPAWPQVEFAILGFAGSDNRSAVPIAEVERWQSEGIVEYLGDTDDVRPFLADADCVVLPSYREGLPRSLLEAAAMAKPMVATDVPGCRDIVVDGESGLLCDARSSASLGAAMEAMLRLDPVERQAMGARGREKVEREFDQQIVVDAYLEALR
jgi:glycosyltransferase involved in cell wall biosynthesis